MKNLSAYVKPLALAFLFSLQAQAEINLPALKRDILSATIPWCDLWQLTVNIEKWTEAHVQDSQVTEKLLKIITWTRNPLLNGQNVHMRRVKRAAATALLSENPSDVHVIKIARSLDKTFGPRAYLNQDVTDYVFIAELLSSWAHNGNLVALEELTRALESNESIKVTEAEFALANTNTLEPNWISAYPEHFSRIIKALGRPWVYSTLQNTYQRDLRFRHHAEGELSFAFRIPISAPLSPQEIEERLQVSPNDGSLFRFFQTLEQLYETPSLMEKKEESIQKIDEALQNVLRANPELKKNAYFSWHVVQAIEFFSLHSTFVDRLLAEWLDTIFLLHPYVVSADSYSEVSLIKDVRRSALEQLSKIQQRHSYAQTVERISTLPENDRGKVGYLYFPAVAFNPTPLDDQALKRALASKNCSPSKKIQLIDTHNLDDTFIQNALIEIARDPRVQSKALDLLNMATTLSPRQVDALGAVLGISSSEEAALYLPYYSNLRRHFSTAQVSTPLGARISRCLTRLRYRFKI